MSTHGAVEDASRLGERADWLLIQRIVASRCFSKAERLRSFLSYIAELSLTGRTHEITEQRIGIQVFDRSSDYNPAEDSIVRSHARLLRQRLAEYYQDEGRFEMRRITIPKGGYVVSFETVAASAAAAVIAADPLVAPHVVAPQVVAPQAIDVPWWRSRALLIVAGAVLCLVAGVALGRTFTPPVRHAPHPLWSLLFQPDRNTLFVSADTGLVMYENIAKRTVTLSEYLSRDYRDHGPQALSTREDVIPDLPTRRYTGIVDLGMALRLTRLADVHPERFQVRFARDLQLQELKEANAILSGALEANPWGELFRAKMNFHLDDDQPAKNFIVRNLRPQSGELDRYFRSRIDHFAYGHIACFPNLADNGRVLILEGTGSAGTEAAADFVLNDQQLLPLLKRIARPGGSIPDFEVLVRTEFLDDGKSPLVKLVAFRAYP